MKTSMGSLRLRVRRPAVWWQVDREGALLDPVASVQVSEPAIALAEWWRTPTRSPAAT